MKLDVTKYTLTLTYYDSDGTTRTSVRYIAVPNIVDIFADTATILINTKDYVHNSLSTLKIEHSEITAYTLNSAVTPIPAMLTIADSIGTEIGTQYRQA